MFYYVYILATNSNSMVYVGVTNDLGRRIREHKESRNNGFTARYGISKLVYFEIFESPIDAIHREKQIKKYSRLKKNNLVEKKNPNWIELH